MVCLKRIHVTNLPNTPHEQYLYDLGGEKRSVQYALYTAGNKIYRNAYCQAQKDFMQQTDAGHEQQRMRYLFHMRLS